MKLWNWFKGLFAPGNRNTTLAAIVPLATAAGMGYGMATGIVPITPQNVSTAAAAASAGIGLMAAKDSKAAPAVTGALDNVAATAQAVDPLYAPIKEAIDAKGEQAKMEAALKAAAAIQGLAPAEQAKPEGLL